MEKSMKKRKKKLCTKSIFWKEKSFWDLSKKKKTKKTRKWAMNGYVKNVLAITHKNTMEK